MRKKHLHRPARSAPEVHRVTTGPRIGGVAHVAESFHGRKVMLAVVAGDGSSGGDGHIVFAAHFAAGRTSPAHCHLLGSIIARIKVQRIVILKRLPGGQAFSGHVLHHRRGAYLMDKHEIFTTPIIHDEFREGGGSIPSISTVAIAAPRAKAAV